MMRYKKAKWEVLSRPKKKLGPVLLCRGPKGNKLAAFGRTLIQGSLFVGDRIENKMM